MSSTPASALKSSRRQSRGMSALANIANKRGLSGTVHPVNLNALLRVYFLDKSSKLIQLAENCTVLDVMVDLKFKLDLEDLSAFALFHYQNDILNRRLSLTEPITKYISKTKESTSDIKLTCHSWLVDVEGDFYSEVFQNEKYVKESNTSLWLAYQEAHHFALHTNKYILTEEESIILGCYILQVCVYVCLYCIILILAYKTLSHHSLFFLCI